MFADRSSPDRRILLWAFSMTWVMLTIGNFVRAGPVVSPDPVSVDVNYALANTVSVSVVFETGSAYNSVRVKVHSLDGLTLVASGSTPTEWFTISSGSNTKSFTITPLSTPLTPGEQYTVEVQALFAGDETNGVFSTNPVTVKPSTPDAVSAVQIDDGKINVTWTHTTGRADKFVIMVTPDIGVHSFEKAGIVDTDGVNLKYVIPDQPVKGQTYIITVTAVSYNTSSAASSGMLLTTIPPNPISVSATETAIGKINVTWTQGEGCVEKFVITIKPPIDGLSTFEKIIPAANATHSGASQEMVIPNQPVEGTAYLVTVRAESHGVSSDDIAANPPLLIKPSNPTSVNAVERSPGSIAVIWIHGGGYADKFIVTVNPSIKGQTEFEKTVPAVSRNNPDPNQELVIPEQAGKGYTYNVTVRAAVNGISSEDVAATAPLTIKPSNSSAVSGEETIAGKVKVTWTQGEGRVDKFVVTVSPPIGGNSTFEKVVPAVSAENSGAILELVIPDQPIAGNAYNVAVTSIASDVEGDPVPADQPVYIKPSNPSSVKAEETAGKIKVTWTHGGGYAHKFVISVSPAIRSQTTFVKNVTVGNAGLVAADQELIIPDEPMNGQTYAVTVTAVSNEIRSDDIPAALTVTKKPSNPTSVSATEASDGKIKATWTHGEGLADRFVLTVSPAIGNTSEFVKDVPAQNVNNPGSNQELVISSQPTKGETYTITIRAESNGVMSDDVPAESLTIKPSNPIYVVAQETESGYLMVNWTHGGGRANKFVVTLNPPIGNQAVFEKTIPVVDADNPDANQELVVPIQSIKGETYTITVRAVSSNVPSDDVPVTPDVTIRPSDPISVRAQETVLGEINVTWIQGVGFMDLFVVTVSPAIGGQPTYEKNISTKRKRSVQNPGAHHELVLPNQPIAGVTYSVRVRAVSNSVSSNDVPASQPITTKPSDPRSVKAVETNLGKIQLSWTHGGGPADQFVINVNTTNGNSSQYVQVVPPASVEDPGVSQQFVIPDQPTKGQTYTITVRAESLGESSNDVPAPDLTTKPSNPSSVVVGESNLGMVQVNWTHDEGRADKFVVTVNPAINNQITFEKSIPVISAGNPESSQELVIPNAPVKGQTYTVTVRAVSDGVPSDDVPGSAAITVTPPVPINLSADTSPQEMRTQVHWSKGEGIVTTFFAIISKGDWQEEATKDPSSTSHDFTLPESGEYTVTVKAQSGEINSTDSAPLTVILATPPVILCIVNKTSRTAELSWERKDPNAKNYRLKVKQSGVCILDVLFAENGSPPQPASPECSGSERETFNASKNLFTYNLAGLLPHTEYKIEIFPKAAGYPEETEPASVSLLTNAEVPGVINNTSVRVEGPEDVTVCWSKPEPQPGPTNYTVTVTDHGDDPKNDIVTVVPGYDNNCTRVGALDKFWPYSVSIRAVTDAGAGEASDPLPFRTAESAPGRVLNFKVVNSTTKPCTVDITWEAPAPRDRNANITAFTLQYQYQGPTDLGAGNITTITMPWSPNKIYSTSVVVYPEHDYIFTVYARSGDLAGNTTSVRFTATNHIPGYNGGSLSTGELVGIAVGVGAVVGFFAFLIYHCVCG